MRATGLEARVQREPAPVWMERLTALANIPLVIPSAMAFCRYHMWHHIFLGVPHRDNDLPVDN